MDKSKSDAKSDASNDARSVEIDAAYIDWAHRQVDRLLKLKATSMTALGEQSAHGKDDRASQALALLEKLAFELGGWAVHHRMGLSIAEVSSPPRMLSSADLNLYIEQTRDADRHDHERAGGAYGFADDDVNRRIATNLLTANPSAIPRALSWMVARGLASLDFGEQIELFKPRKSGKHQHALTQIGRRLHALEHYDYLRGLGVGQQDASQQVGDAFGVQHEGLKNWMSDLPKLLGQAEVRKRRAMARWQGRRMRESQKLAKPSSDQVDERSNIERYYGISSLRRRGKKYRTQAPPVLYRG